MDQINLFEEYKDAFKEEEASPKKKAPFEYAYSPFALQDAIGEKNVKKIWIEYQKLILIGIEPEDIFYKILSKARDLLAIKKGASQADLGLKDFPYIKSKKDSNNWSEGEIGYFYQKLVTLYHKARLGEEEFDVALERTLLQA